MVLVDFFDFLFQIINRLINILKTFATLKVFWIFDVFKFLLELNQLVFIIFNILWNGCLIFSVFFNHLMKFSVIITGIGENLINFWIRIFSGWWKLIICFFKFFDLLKTGVNYIVNYSLSSFDSIFSYLELPSCWI